MTDCRWSKKDVKSDKDKFAEEALWRRKERSDGRYHSLVSSAAQIAVVPRDAIVRSQVVRGFRHLLPCWAAGKISGQGSI